MRAKNGLLQSAYIAEFHEAIEAIDNGNKGPYNLDRESQVELAHNAKWDSVFDSMEEAITRYKEFLKYRRIREFTEHFSYYGLHDFLSSLEIAIEYVNDTVKVNNPLEVLFGVSEDEDSLLSLIANAKSTEEVINRIWEERNYDDNEKDQNEDYESSNRQLPTFFNMMQVDMIHKLCNKEQFEDISPGDMYSIFNLHDCPRRLKVRSGEKNRVYYFIFFFGEMIDTSHRAMWRKSMCHHFCMSYKTYNSKYTELKTKPSKKDERYLERLDELKEDFEELREAS